MRHPDRRHCFLVWSCFLALLLTLAPAWAASGPFAVIQSLSGQVTVSRRGATLSATRGGFALQAEDHVRTGANGRAVVVTASGKRASLFPNSAVVLRANGGHVETGRVIFWITGRGRTQIGTQNGIAAIDGTVLMLDVTAAATTLTVQEGEVGFFNDLGRVTVRAGQESIARPGEAPTRPAAAAPDALILFEATVENLALSLEAPRLNLPPAQVRASLPQREEAVRAAATAANLVALGDARWDLGDTEGAREAYRRAVDLAPADRTALARLAIAETARRRTDLAAEAVAALEKAAPESAEAALASGTLLLARGREGEAVTALRKAVSLSDTAEARLALGRALFRTGDLAAAEASFRRALELQPENHAAHAYLATTHLAAGRLEPAAAAAQRAVELAPESLLAREARATVLVFSGQPEAAAKELRAVVEARPEAATARLQLARALAASGELPEALDEAAAAVSADPTDAGARVTLGVLYLANRDPQRAEREFKYALVLRPDMGSARTGLASAALDRGALSEALAQQKAGIDLDQGSAAAHNNLGAVYLAEGQLPAAADAFRRAIALQPEYALAHGNLALTYLEQNRYQLAIEEGLLAVRLGDRSALLRTTLARIYMKQNRFDRALVELRTAERLDPFYPLQRFYLGQIYRLQGRDRDSLRALFRAIALDPSAMVEQRTYSRVEGSVAGGENSTFQGDLKVDGRAADGRLSYFAAGSEFRGEVRRENGDLRQHFGEAILGYESSARNNAALYGSIFAERGGRPGRDLGSRLVEDVNFRARFDASDVQLLDRYRYGRRSWITLKGGYRHGYLDAHNPGNPAGQPDLVLFTFFGARDRSFLAEALWEMQLGRRNRDLIQAGVSLQERERTFTGNIREVPGPGLLTIRNADDPLFTTAWAEFKRQVNRRLDFTVGPYIGARSGGPVFIRPKAVVHYDAGGGNQFAGLIYPTFQTQNGDLLPVESWAKPFDLETIVDGDDAILDNYELTWERTTGHGGLLSATAFYRRGRSLVVPIVDPGSAPVVTRLFFDRGEIFGGELAAEKYLTGNLALRVFGRLQETNSLSSPGDLPYFPRWTAGARLDYQDRRGIRAFLAGTYIGSRAHQEFVGGPETRLDGFFRVDFRVSWQENLHRSYFIQVTDLFDQGDGLYRGYHTAGRTLIGGIEFRF